MLRNIFKFICILIMFQSIAKPADWKYQSGVCSSWITVSCCLNVDIVLSLPSGRINTEIMDKCLKVCIQTNETKLLWISTAAYAAFWNIFFLFKEELKVWAQKISNGVFLLDGKKLPDDTELTAGQVCILKASVVHRPRVTLINYVKS